MASLFAIIEGLMPAERAVPIESVPCNLCQSSELDVIVEARQDLERDRDLARKFRASGDELLTQPLVRCRRCGLQFVNPRVAASAILDGYAAGADPEYVSQMDARVRTFASALGRIERLAPGRGRLLDVGTAAGAFLKAACDAGWDAVGVEPNGWLAEWGREHYGVRIQVGSIDDVPLTGTFDVVTLWDVIEHTPDPMHVLARVNMLLRPGGLLVVNYPDIGSWIARAFGRRWPFLSSVHLYYFTRETMGAALRRAGFDTIEMSPYRQRLQLAYIARRGEVISPALSRLGRSVVRSLGLERVEVPYWIGQTFVAARKARAPV
jgi:2-polyprenyl-3-methyl-5-hydroxy-6-metoxy-1,4-benzoquinol methylase